MQMNGQPRDCLSNTLNMNCFPSLIFVSMMVISTSASAEVYKCVNSEGKVSYTETPCEGAGNTQQKLKPVASPPIVQKKEPSLAEQNEEFKRRQAAQQAYENCLNNRLMPVCHGPTEWAIRKR